MRKPLISICIPVFNSEKWLEECLESIKMQNVKEIEVLVLSDCSSGLSDEGLNCKQIVKKFKKSVRFPVKYLEHTHNQGLVEVRRGLCYSASGKYIFMMDSDDILAPQGLDILLKTAQENQADFDIVHGASKNFFSSKKNELEFTEYGNKNLVKPCCYYERDVFDKFLTKDYSSFLWGKLYKRELLLLAFEKIPYNYCNLAENYLIYFFTALYAKSYCGIQDEVYYYRQKSGMTAANKIETIEQWKFNCSAATVFSILFTWQKEEAAITGKNPLTPEENLEIQKDTVRYIQNNLKILEELVIPELQQEAYKILCDFWGENLVKRVEKTIKA